MNDSPITVVQNLIYEIRGKRVMLDSDLARLYQVTTGNLNKAVKRNIKRFPPDFMFQLSKEEFDVWVKYQLSVCEREDLQGYSCHMLYICKKN